jgi:UDP-glucose 4-epimerase
MTILITGATGFIGRRLVERLLTDSSPADLACLITSPSKHSDDLTVETWRQIGIRMIEGDLTNPSVTPEPPPRVDVIFHLAGNIDTTASIKALRVNDAGCTHLLSWLGHGAAGARLVYASSIAVIDRSGPARQALNEASPCVPRTEYGRSKLRGEQIIQAAAAELQYQYTIVRLATVYGPGAKAGGLFDRLLRGAVHHRLLARLNWPGRTSIVHVEDAAAIMVMLGRRPDAANQIYCVANPEAPTIGELGDNIAGVVHSSGRPVHLPSWAWRLGRSIAWSRSAQLLGAIVAHTTLWRLTLMLDDGFWFDTEKLLSVWTGPTKDVLEALAEMVKYL